MNLAVEKECLNDVLKWEQNKYFSREKVTILAGEDIPVGSVSRTGFQYF